MLYNHKDSNFDDLGCFVFFNGVKIVHFQTKHTHTHKQNDRIGQLFVIITLTERVRHSSICNR